MKKQIKIVDEKKGIIQITTCDERWYAIDAKDPVTGLPKYRFVPSVTWICEFYPKGIAFYKWLANKGWDEAEALKIAAGDKGSKIHHAVGALIDGDEVRLNSQFVNPSTEQLEELTIEEYEAVLSFANWYKATKPLIDIREYIILNEKENYAGIIDVLCKIDGLSYVVDFKTSQYVWPSHELQISAYKHALEKPENYKLAILQLGYRRNKKGYKFTEIEDKYDEFLAAKVIWQNETKGAVPPQKDYPLSIKLEKEK